MAPPIGSGEGRRRSKRGRPGRLNAHPGRDRGRRSGRTAAGAAVAARRHRFGHHREPQPRLHRASHPGRPARAMGGRSAGRARGRRAHAARGHVSSRHPSQFRRRAALHRLSQPDRQGRHHLWPAGGREGRGDATARRRRADPVRGRRRLDPRLRARPAEDPLPSRRRRASDRLRLHRRLRRLSRHLPSWLSGRAADDLRARVSVRLARHPD